MKARFDFVSNSSSCSFTILDVKKFMQEISKIASCLPWWVENAVKFRVECLEKDAEELELRLAETIYKWQKYADYDIEHKWPLHLEDPHEIYNVYFYRLSDPENADLLDKMTKITIETSEENDSVAESMIALMYMWAKAKGINVDSSSSEKDILDNDDNFLVKIINDLANHQPLENEEESKAK